MVMRLSEWAGAAECTASWLMFGFLTGARRPGSTIRRGRPGRIPACPRACPPAPRAAVCRCAAAPPLRSTRTARRPRRAGHTRRRRTAPARVPERRRSAARARGRAGSGSRRAAGSAPLPRTQAGRRRRRWRRGRARAGSARRSPARGRSSPGALAELLLVSLDSGGLLHGEADIVEAVEEAVLAVLVDLELDHAAVGAADLLGFEVDGERRVGA